MSNLAKISSFCETNSGGTPSRDKADLYYGGTIPWVKSGELRENFITDTEEKITALALQESAAKLNPANSILLAMYGATVGRMAVLGIEAATNQAVCAINPDPKKADLRYVFHALQNKVPEFLLRAKGGAQPNISQGMIRDTEIHLPPLEEQKRIAAILDKADSLRRKRQQAISLADDFLRAVFLDMFGDPVTNPKGWPIVAFGDVVKNCDGQRVPVSSADRALRQGSYPYYGASGVIDTIDDFLFEGPSLLIGEDGANLLAQSTPIAFIATGKYWVNNHAHVLQENGKACLEFLEFAINQMRLDDYITGSAQPKLNQANLNRIPIALPPIELQKKFVANRSAIGKLQEKHNISLTVVGDISSALQNEAFA